VSRTAGIHNPKQAEAAAAAQREAVKLKQAELAAQARRAMSASSKHRASASSSLSATSSTRPRSAHPSSSSSNKASLSHTTAGSPLSPSHHAHVAHSPTRGGHHSRLQPFPLSTCSSAACKAELALAYSTLSAHQESAAVQATLVADLRHEVAMLRKQLTLYRIEGAPRDWSETGLAAAAAAAGAMGLPVGSPAEERRRAREARERERAMLSASGAGGASAEEAKQNDALWRQSSLRSNSGGSGGGFDQRPPPLTLQQSFDRAANSSSSIGGGGGGEARFQAPMSPSSRERLRAFGGAGSERLDGVSLSQTLGSSGGGGLVAALRSPSGSSFSRQGSQYDTHAAERDDLVAELNGGRLGSSTGAAGAAAAFSMDRRPSYDRRASDSGGAGGGPLGATLEFNVNYGEP
jgi:hypothetical protein